MNSQNSRIFPFVWPWKGAHNQSLPFGQLVKQKAFSISYLLVIWSIVGLLGFASTRNCEGTWQLALQCDFAIWAKNFRGNSPIFVRNLFTTLFFHNGLDHILFVSIIGILLIVQSYETFFGPKMTVFLFFSAYFIGGLLFGVFYTVGLDLFPDSRFIQLAFERNWMGGSVGMFHVYGALAVKSRKPWVMLIAPVVLEMINYFLLGISPHISLMHLSAVFIGYVISLWLVKK